MRSMSMGIGMALLLAGALSLWGAERNGTAEKPPAGQTDRAAIMRAKLASTQKIVEGLLANDFVLIQRGGDELDRIGHSDAWAAAEDTLEAKERQHILEILRRERGNKAKADRVLGIHRRKLYRLLDRLQIDSGEF